jgi:integrase
MAKRKNEAYWNESKQSWQINVQYDGERKSFYSSVEGKKGKIEAEKKADKWLESHTQNENIRFGRLWDEFLKEAKDTTGTANYNKHEQIGRIWLLPLLKNKKVMAITTQDFQECINAAYKKGLSKKTLQNTRGTITAFCKYAKKSRIPIERSVDLMIPKDAPVKEKHILQPDDFKKLFTIDYINHFGKQEQSHYIYAWRLMALTGLRRGELCGLQNDDIKDGVLYVRRAINKENEITNGKTKNAIRYMVLPDMAKELIAKQKKLLIKKGIISNWLFPDEYGQNTVPDRLYKRWLRYRNQHGIKCSLHELRHTLISVAKADIPEQLLKQVVGHSKSMDTFGIYGHKVDGELERVAKIFNNIFNTLLK